MKNMQIWIPVIVAVITALGGIGAVVVPKLLPQPTPTAIATDTPTPTPTVIATDTPTPTPIATPPPLHATYSGTMLRSDGMTFNFTITSLSEDSNGGFMAQGSLGDCTSTASGTVYSDDTLDFNAVETNNPNVNGCNGLTCHFTGELYPDGHLAGDWDYQNTNFYGTWTVS